jgi:uncharacterized protein (UPF0548 family)
MNLNYPEVGASLADPMPAGYNHLRYRTPIGHGPTTMRAATETLLSLSVYRRIGLRVDMAEKRARVGATVVVHLGFLRAPCQFVWVEDAHDRAGWGYGTRTGHPVRGEESFILTRDQADQVWLEVRSFSRPAIWYTRLASPLIPTLQRLFARRCGQALRAGTGARA